jgi:nucleoside-diphosphate-sugar epimerase
LEGILPGEPDRLINQVHRDDLVSALLLVADRRAQCRGEVFNVVGDAPISAREAHAFLSSRLKRSLPERTADARPSKRGQSNKRVSNRKLRELGWDPRYPTFEVAMSENILPSFGF